MTPTKAWCAYNGTYAILDTIASTSKQCWNKLSDEQKDSYYARIKGGKGIELKKILIQDVQYFNAERRKS